MDADDSADEAGPDDGEDAPEPDLPSAEADAGSSDSASADASADASDTDASSSGSSTDPTDTSGDSSESSDSSSMPDIPPDAECTHNDECGDSEVCLDWACVDALSVVYDVSVTRFEHLEWPGACPWEHSWILETETAAMTVSTSDCPIGWPEYPRPWYLTQPNPHLKFRIEGEHPETGDSQPGVNNTCYPVEGTFTPWPWEGECMFYPNADILHAGDWVTVQDQPVLVELEIHFEPIELIP